MLSLQEDSSDRIDSPCPGCGHVQPLVTSSVLDEDDAALALVRSALAHHEQEGPVAWLDAVSS